MTPTRDLPVTICHVLREDPQLIEAIPMPDRDRAAEECIAATAWIPTGPWSGPKTDITRDGIGLLVLHGLLIRHLRVGGRFSSELLGERDLLRPWQGEGPQTLPQRSDWRVLEPTRVAVLDDRAARRLANYPELTGQLVARAVERSRSLAVNMAIVQQSRTHIRVHLMLWHLADRWGYVSPEGTILPLRLTHDVLADLVAARRPTVSSALAFLARSGVVRPTGKGWLLLGRPPPSAR